MKIYKMCVLLLAVCLCMMMCACDIGRLLNRNEEAPQQENSFIKGESDIQLQPDQPGSIYHYAVGPDGGSMSVIIGGETDKGGISIDVPVATAPPEETNNADFAGVWQSLRYDSSMVFDGHTGGSATTWYLCENGYALYESSEGEIDVERDQYWLNYTYARLYGPYSIENGVFTFTVEEDWLYTAGPNMGETWTYPIYTGADGFIMEEYGSNKQYKQIEDASGYLDTIRKANGGPTGNNLYDPNWVEPEISQGPKEGQVGQWVAYTEKDNGRVLQEIWKIESNGDCYIEVYTLYYDGSQWQVDSYGDNVGGYICYVNGQMQIGVGPDLYGTYDVTINGDTMQVHYFDGEGREINTTFNRYTGDDVPMP